MMRLAACAHDLAIVDRYHRLRIADEGVGCAREATPESRELHVLLLQRPVREELRDACEAFVQPVGAPASTKRFSSWPDSSRAAKSAGETPLPPNLLR